MGIAHGRDVDLSRLRAPLRGPQPDARLRPVRPAAAPGGPRRPRWSRRFERFRDEVLRCGPAAVLPERTRVAFQTRMSFAAVSLRTRWLDGHVVLGEAPAQQALSRHPDDLAAERRPRVPLRDAGGGRRRGRVLDRAGVSGRPAAPPSPPRPAAHPVGAPRPGHHRPRGDGRDAPGRLRRGAARSLGCPIPRDWRGQSWDWFHYRLLEYADDPASLPWSARALVRRGRAAGHRSATPASTGLPTPGGVAEIGYEVVPSQRRKGYASEAAVRPDGLGRDERTASGGSGRASAPGTSPRWGWSGAWASSGSASRSTRWTAKSWCSSWTGRWTFDGVPLSASAGYHGLPVEEAGPKTRWCPAADCSLPSWPPSPSGWRRSPRPRWPPGTPPRRASSTRSRWTRTATTTSTACASSTTSRVRHALDADGAYPFSVDGYTVTGVGAAQGRHIDLTVAEHSGPPDVEARPAVTYTPTSDQPVASAGGPAGRGPDRDHRRVARLGRRRVHRRRRRLQRRRPRRAPRGGGHARPRAARLQL